MNLWSYACILHDYDEIKKGTLSLLLHCSFTFLYLYVCCRWMFHTIGTFTVIMCFLMVMCMKYFFFFDINYIFSLLNIEILMKQRRTLLIQENLTSPKVASLINVQLCHAPRAQSNYWFLEVTIIIDNCVLHISIQCCWQNIFLIIFIYLLFLPRFH